jgi:hypothetical protein
LRRLAPSAECRSVAPGISDVIIESREHLTFDGEAAGLDQPQ